MPRSLPAPCLALLAALLSGCTASLPTQGVPAPGTYEQKVAGLGRTYRVHVPPGYDGRKPMPLVIALHGVFSSAAGMEGWSGLDAVADRRGFIVAYPDGTAGSLGLMRHWNSGHVWLRAHDLGIDDVAFLARVIEDVEARLAVDRKRVAMCGHSNGGMMAYRFAAERPGVLSAIAVVAGTIGGKPVGPEPEWRIPVPSQPVPVLIIHGTDDESVPYWSLRGRDTRGPGTMLPVSESAAFWLRANRCDPVPQVERALHDRVLRYSWKGAAPVRLVVLEGWDHRWPGTEFIDPGGPFAGFDAAEEMGNFFSNF